MSANEKNVKLPVTSNHFKCNGIWYVQPDGLAMGTTLAEILTNVCMKPLEALLQKRHLSEHISKFDQNGNCRDCNRRGFPCEKQNITKKANANMHDVVWVCTHCSNERPAV